MMKRPCAIEGCDKKMRLKKQERGEEGGDRREGEKRTGEREEERGKREEGRGGGKGKKGRV